MTAPTFNPVPGPSPSASKLDRSFRMLVGQMGDGYSQRAPDGLNPLVRSATLSWEVLTKTELQTILTFVDALHGSLPFYWTPFGEDSPVVFAMDWKSDPNIVVTPINQTTFSLRMSIRQVGDIV